MALQLLIPFFHFLSQKMEWFGLLAVVEQETGINQVLRSTGTTRLVVMTTLYNFAGLNNRKIGDIMGVDPVYTLLQKFTLPLATKLDTV